MAVNIEIQNIPEIDNSWHEILQDEFESDYFLRLMGFLNVERKTQSILPSWNNVFSAFNHTSFNDVKVVIIGQDPYHGIGQANGLCFSVSPGIKPPPSLANIFKELNSDLGIPVSKSGDLSSWADQGVLLLNATLTVRANAPGSHQKKGWETFTDAVINTLSKNKKGLVFLLWGNFAHGKEKLIDASKHFILKAAHPSPFSVHKGFFGCRHFSKTNEILRQLNLKEIDWNINS